MVGLVAGGARPVCLCGVLRCGVVQKELTEKQESFKLAMYK